MGVVGGLCGVLGKGLILKENIGGDERGGDIGVGEGLVNVCMDRDYWGDGRMVVGLLGNKMVFCNGGRLLVWKREY